MRLVREPPLAWRPAMLTGATAGLLVAPLAPAPSPPPTTALVIAAAAGAALIPLRPRRRAGTVPWLLAVAACAALAGLGLGAARLAAIDDGALRAGPGREVTATGMVVGVPRYDDGTVELPVETADGRLLVRARGAVSELSVGDGVRASGRTARPQPWREGWLRRIGVTTVLEARVVHPTGRRRGGIEGVLDRVRERAEAALERGMPPAEAALARGFVLGQDDRIDPRTVTEFKRSGLAHLLAVSGQNVMLLALLAWPLLAALGIPLRTRLLCIAILIAVYVPVAGAGPSIQRAGAMGLAGVVAALAGRPGSRWYAVLLAAFATLAVNPRSAGDVGWQLSFAAVIGILLWSRPLAGFIIRLLGAEGSRDGWQRALAEGAAMTIAATVATAPLMAHHFEAVSVAALPANLLALPAVAPVMWLGMLTATAGQLPGIPVEPLNWVNAALVAYVAGIGELLAGPDWAMVDLGLPTPVAVTVAYAVLVVAGALLCAWGGRRRGLAPRLGLAALVAVPAAILAPGPSTAPADDRPPAPSLAVRVLDVGQGDAILLDPPDGAAVLVDGGPLGGELVEQLRTAGAERLAAVVVTHDQSDHAGGIPDALAAMPVGALGHGRIGGDLLAAARAAGVRRVALSEGATMRSGSLRLDVLWPPHERLDSRVDAEHDVNATSLVVLARWRGFAMLLTGDAEAEAVPLDPGPIDVLKVAHHGSEDAGLGRLVERSRPRLATISVGSDNPHGHPAPTTLSTLAEHGVPVLRTDRHGDIAIDAAAGQWTVRPDR